MTVKQRRVRIVQDHDPGSPREWDNMGRMVCWHRNYNLGDEQPSENNLEWKRSLAVEACPRLGDIIEYWDNDGFDALHDKLGTWEATHKVIDEHVANLVDAVLDAKFVILPLYLYDHSGITISTGAFSCPWDSGQVGYVYCSLDTAKENWLLTDGDWNTTVEYPGGPITLREATIRNLKCEVNTYDDYLTGSVYGYIVEEYDECGECETCGHCADSWEETDSCWGFFGSDVETNGIADALGHDEKLVAMAKDADVEYER